MLQEGHIDQAVVLGHADPSQKVPDRLGGVAPPAHPREGGHPRIVPAADDSFLHQLDQLPFAQDRVAEVEAGKLDLLRTGFHVQLIQKPVVQGPVVFKLQGADRMGDPLDGVREAMGKVVHRIDAPLRLPSGNESLS